MKKKGNNFAFIDSQNVNLAIRELGWRLDFRKFRIYLKEKFGVSKAFLFIGYIKQNELLYKKLKSYGYTLVYKPTVKDNFGKAKGNIDAELVLHASAIEYANYDQAVVVSGDGDFYCLIEYLIKQNKLGKIIVPNNRFSSLLKKFSNFIVNIQLFKGKLTK